MALEVVNLARGRAARASTPDRHPKCRGRSSPPPPKGGTNAFFQSRKWKRRKRRSIQTNDYHTCSLSAQSVCARAKLAAVVFLQSPERWRSTGSVTGQNILSAQEGGAPWQKASLYVRIELTTSRLTVSRSTNWANRELCTTRQNQTADLSRVKAAS